MPVVGIPVARLRALLGREIQPPDLLAHLGYLGCDVEGYTELRRLRCTACGAVAELTSADVPPACDACGGNLRAGHVELAPLEVVRMDLLPVRPDMFDPGGLARALRGYLGIETGLASYPLGAPALTLHVDPAVRDPQSYRPEIAAALVTGLELDEDGLKVVMKLQENLHWAIGRDRKHASIGVYDADRVGDELTYTVADPRGARFVPLGSPGTDARFSMSLEEILSQHPKGKDYAHLLRPLQRYPLLHDAAGRVLSMPPIINSEETKVTPRTSRVVIDVTGLGRRVVARTLNIVVSSLLENFPAARAHAVRVLAPDGARLTPDFTPQEVGVDAAAAARILGLALTGAQIAELLGRMRHGAVVESDGRVRVQVAAYRNDILHEMDLVEDIAIAYGYHRVTPVLVPTFTVGEERAIETVSDRARELLCGLGFLEVMTLVLTNPRDHDELLGQETQAAVRIANPVSSEQSLVRTGLLPGLLATLRINVTQPLPQRIFEVGDVTLPDATAETLARDRRRVGCAIVSPRIGFEDVKALAEALAREFGRRTQLRALRAAPFLEGRAAELCAEPEGARGEATRLLWFGEVHPEVLERCGLQNPAVLLEGDLEALGGLD